MKKELLDEDSFDDFDEDLDLWEKIPEKAKKELIKTWKDEKQKRHYIG